jgi:hypothetical protein
MSKCIKVLAIQLFGGHNNFADEDKFNLSLECSLTSSTAFSGSGEGSLGMTELEL